MRLTAVLNQVNYKRHFRRIWKRQGKLQAEELQIPSELSQIGVPIQNAKDILLETKLFKPIVQTIIPFPLYPLPPSALTQQKCYFVMNDCTRVSENENQTLALTKTVMYQGLPKQIETLVDADSLPNQDDLVQTCILQATVWDADQSKLPKKVDEARPGYVFKRAYGIPYRKKVCALLEKFSFLGDCAVGKYPASLYRNKIIGVCSEVTVNRKGDCVTFTMPADILMTSDKPLSRFASEKEVAGTIKMDVPNIYPIKPTLDLRKVFEMPEVSMNTVGHRNHLHTLFLAKKIHVKWTPNQLLSRAIGTCFAFASKEAKIKYGVNIKQLPEPVTLQCVYTDLNFFNFITYQLNTLELEHDEGVKNQVWIDEPSKLCEEISEKNLISGYNPAVFSKFLAFYVNGLHSLSM